MSQVFFEGGCVFTKDATRGGASIAPSLQQALALWALENAGAASTPSAAAATNITDHLKRHVFYKLDLQHTMAKAIGDDET